MKNVAGFCLQNQELSAEPFHYTMCGLDDIYLLNGYKVEENKYGRGVSIHAADDLHHAIGLYLIQKRKVLGPKDVRFLRKNMRVTQEELAGVIGVTGQSVARYEKGITEIPGPVDRLLRLFYVLFLIPEPDRSEFLERLSQAMKEHQMLDETADEPVYFGNSLKGWEKTRLTKPHEMLPMSVYA